MRNSKKTVTETFATDLVFAAACAAHRINGGYLKMASTKYDEKGEVVEEKVANKHLVASLLTKPELITDEDRAFAAKVMTYCRSVTFKMLQGRTVTDFEQAMLRIVELEAIASRYDIAVVSSLPASYERSEVRIAQNARLRESAGTLTSAVGTKVELEVEVIRCNFSNQWETFFVTAIVDGASVFFAQKRAVEVGSTIRIKGRIKDHKSDRTQLSHVKVL